MLTHDRRFIGIWCGFLFTFIPCISMAQSQILVQILSNDMDAAAYADSLYLGPASGSPYWVHPATRTIRLSTLRAAAWSMPPIQVPLEAEPGDSVRVTLNFPNYHRIESYPFGAEAWLQEGAKRRLLGLTPVVFSSSGTIDGMFHIERKGYIPSVVKPKTDLWNRYEISLKALAQVNERSGLSPAMKQRRSWIDWGTAALAMAAGVVAVHYKFRADQINDEYLMTGDASLRPRVARLDDYSGVALGVMQAGLVTLAVRFALK